MQSWGKPDVFMQLHQRVCQWTCNWKKMSHAHVLMHLHSTFMLWASSISFHASGDDQGGNTILHNWCASEHANERKWVMHMFSCVSIPHPCYGLHPCLSMQVVMTRGEIQFCISERPHEQYADSYQSTEKNCVLTVELKVSTSRIFSMWLSTICRWRCIFMRLLNPCKTCSSGT